MCAMNEEQLNALSRKIIGCCIAVHGHFGPGLFEKIYENSLMEELKCSGINARSQVEVELFYRGKPMGKGYFIDILVEDEIILEIKAVNEMNPIFEAQLLSYLKLSNKKLGLLINFNSKKLISGVQRMVNGL